MSTKFGKEVRKLRVDKEITLKEMAEGLHVPSSYLSAIEAGRKKLTTGFLQKVVNFLALSQDDEQRLYSAGASTMESYNIELHSLSDSQKDTVSMFARNLSNLSEKELQQIRKILGAINK